MVQEDEILAQLDRILLSTPFVNAARSRQFLSFCVTSALRGDRSHLKETTIAVAVFQRDATYDPKADPIVRVHARRVREKLHLYYRTAGSADPIMIVLPKGTYVPQYSRSAPVVEPAPGPLKELIASPAAPALPPVEPIIVAAPARRGHRAGIAALLVLIVAAAALLLLVKKWPDRRAAIPQSAASQPRLMDWLPANVSEAAWSHDDKTVAYAQSGPQHPSWVYIVPAGSGEKPRRVSEGAGEEYEPVWSPDDRQVAFVRMVDGVHFVIVRHELATGVERVSRPFVAYIPARFVRPTLDWSPDGQYFLTAEQVSPGVPMRLILVRVRDDTRSFLTSPPIESAGDVEGKFSPDGRLVAFHRGGHGDLYVVDAGGERDHKARQLTFDNPGVRGMAFSPDGKSILFGTASPVRDGFGISRIPVSGGAPERVTARNFDATQPVLIAQDEVAFLHAEWSTQLMEMRGDGMSPVSLPGGNWADHSASYSPSGDGIAFFSNRSGTEEVWYLGQGQPAPEQLTQLGGDGLLLATPRWSPNGELLAFCVRKRGLTDIYLLHRKSRAVEKLTHTSGRDYNPVFSHDGRYIIYSSNEDGTPRLWRMGLEGSHHAEPLFTQAVSNFLCSADGRWLYYLDSQQPLSLYRLNLEDGATQLVYRTNARPALLDSLAVTREGVYLALADQGSATPRIERIDPSTGHAHTVWRIPAYEGAPLSAAQNFDVSPDGTRLLTSKVIRSRSAIFAVKVP